MMFLDFLLPLGHVAIRSSEMQKETGQPRGAIAGGGAPRGAGPGRALGVATGRGGVPDRGARAGAAGGRQSARQRGHGRPVHPAGDAGRHARRAAGGPGQRRRFLSGCAPLAP